MPFAFYNIAKANARISELEKEVADLKAKPAPDNPGALTDAVASNEALSQQLDTEKKNAEKMATDLSAATGTLNNINASLKAACAALNLSVAEGGDYVEAMKTAVSSTLAKLAVPAASIPAAGATQTVTGQVDTKTKSRSEFEKLSPKAAMDFIKTGGRITD